MRALARKCCSQGLTRSTRLRVLSLPASVLSHSPMQHTCTLSAVSHSSIVKVLIHTKTCSATPCCGPDFWHAWIDYHNQRCLSTGNVNSASALGKRRSHSQCQDSRRPPEYTISFAGSQEVSAKFIYEGRRRKLEAGWRSVRA